MTNRPIFISRMPAILYMLFSARQNSFRSTSTLFWNRKSRALACRTPVTAHYPEVPRLPWVTVSDKSSAADIPRQWPAIGLANYGVRGGLLEFDRFRAALSI
jgi:hypothetical protein